MSVAVQSSYIRNIHFDVCLAIIYLVVTTGKATYFTCIQILPCIYIYLLCDINPY